MSGVFGRIGSAFSRSLQYISGVEQFEQWDLNNRTVYVFGEDHSKGTADGCKSCNGVQCQSFLQFIDALSAKKELTLVLLELSFVNQENIDLKNRPSLAVVPPDVEKSNLTEIRKAYLDCIYRFDTSKCPHHVTMIPADLRLEKTFDNNDPTLESKWLTSGFRDMHAAVLALCKDKVEQVSVEDLKKRVKSKRALDSMEELIQNPAKKVYNFIERQVSNDDTTSMLAQVVRHLQSPTISPDVSRMQHNEFLASTIALVMQYYDSVLNDVDNKRTGRDVRTWLQKHLVRPMKKSTPASPVFVNCKDLADHLFMYISSFGTAITDLFIMLFILSQEQEVKNVVILTGSYHTPVYHLLLEQYGGKLVRRGTPNSPDTKNCLRMSS